MSSTIQFFGGVGMVTGSNFLLSVPSEHKNIQILIDCGLAQGPADIEALNWKPFAYTPADIELLFVTHAHIDHIGRIPKLIRDGFKGRIISTEPTRAIAEPLLRDALSVLSHNGRHENLELLYDSDDIANALKRWEVTTLHKKTTIAPDFYFEFLQSGHILGSSMVRFSRNGSSAVFTGDLGGGNSPFLPVVEDISGTTYLVMESVYGDRTRPDDVHRREELQEIIKKAITRGGTLLIPAFSTERTQDLLFDIRSLLIEKQIPHISVYLDSPLAEKLTTAYTSFPEYFAPSIAERMKEGEDIFSFPGLHWVGTAEESQDIMHAPNPKIIIAGSGMSNGGRAIRHEEHILPDVNSTVLVVGYQAVGTLGRRMTEGAKKIRIGRDTVAVRCHIEQLYGYSAHMDSDALLEFVHNTKESLKEVFVVMGEPASSSFLSQRIREYVGVYATTPQLGDKVTIEL